MASTDKHSAKRSRIVETATELFSSRGYAATRMQDIAGALDMQAGSLYYYFDSKESLLGAIVSERVGVAVDMLERIVSEESDPVTRIRRAIEGHLTVFDQHADLYSIFLSERLEAISPELAEQVDELGRTYESLWVGIITEGLAAGRLRQSLDAWLAMKAIVGMCNSTLFWFSSSGSMTPADVAARFADIVLDGMLE